MLPREKGACELCGGSTCGEPVASGWDFEYGTTREEFSVLRCRVWKHLYLADRPAPQAMSVVYPSNYYSFSETSHERPLVAAVRGRLEARKAHGLLAAARHVKSVLDVGCGDGRILDILARQGLGPAGLDGIEIDGRAAALARAKGYAVTQQNFNDFDAGGWERRYDLLLCHQVIEHLRSPREALAKMHTLLRPGGVVSLETPDVAGWDARLFGRRTWGGYHFPRHFHLFNKASLTELLRQEGFDLVRIRSIVSPVFWIHSLHNMLADRDAATKLTNFFHYQNVPLLGVFTLLDMAQIAFAATSSNMQIWARRR